jgi:GAF domain-containing protein
LTSDQTSPEPNEAFLELGKIVLGDQPLPKILERVVHLAKQILPRPTEASITLVAGDEEPTTVAFTNDVALALDERQYETDRGPCLQAAASGSLVRIRDMANDARWPKFAESAVNRGIRSSLSVPLPVQQHVTGALNFYASVIDAFDDETTNLAETFAAHAAVALANAQLYESTARLAEQMLQAMATRAVIEQAKGIIMRDNNCTPDEAFERLVQLSQQSHLKVRDVAHMLVVQVSGTDDSS